jgi:Domain of unknown function (DUF4365)
MSVVVGRCWSALVHLPRPGHGLIMDRSSSERPGGASRYTHSNDLNRRRGDLSSSLLVKYSCLHWVTAGEQWVRWMASASDIPEPRGSASSDGRLEEAVATAQAGGRIEPVDARTFNDCLEQLQEGYVASVAATAGCDMQPIRRQFWGIDVLLIRPPTVLGGQEVSVYAQLKNTTLVKPDPEKGWFSFQFKKRAYLEALARPRDGVKAIALVMATSPQQAKWTIADHESLTTQHCCYWANLEGYPIAPGVQAPSVRISTAKIFDADALTSIMDRLERGEQLS